MEEHPERDTGAVGGSDHAVGGSNIDCDGLLAQHMYTRFGSGHDYLFVYRVRCANGAGVEAWSKQFVNGTYGGGNAVERSELLGASEIGIAAADYLDTGDLLQRAGMVAGDLAAADDSDFQRDAGGDRTDR